MRVTTFNVRGFRDGWDGVAAVVIAIDPDLLLLQETGSRRALRRFAAATGMRAARDPWSPLRRRVKNAVLVREPLRPSPSRLVRFARANRWYPGVSWWPAWTAGAMGASGRSRRISAWEATSADGRRMHCSVSSGRSTALRSSSAAT